MKRLLSTLAIFLLVAPYSQADTKYISDELFTYMHTGPGTQYRIIGSVNAGTPVTIVATNAKEGYVQIVDNKDRKGWIESKYVTSQPSLRTRYPELEAELKQVKQELSTAQGDAQAQTKDLIESLNQRTVQLQVLEKKTSELNQQLNDDQEEIRALRARLDTQKDDLLMRYFTYGGLVAGGGLLFGLLLPHIIPRRKKQPNGWA